MAQTTPKPGCGTFTIKRACSGAQRDNPTVVFEIGPCQCGVVDPRSLEWGAGDANAVASVSAFIAQKSAEAHVMLSRQSDPHGT